MLIQPLRAFRRARLQEGGIEFGAIGTKIDRRTSNGECTEEWRVGRGSIEN